MVSEGHEAEGPVAKDFSPSHHAPDDNETMTQVTVNKDTYIEPFEGFLETIGNEPAWLTPLRRAALSRFSELGFPTRRDEEWRFTDVRPIAETTFRHENAIDHDDRFRSDKKQFGLFVGSVGSLLESLKQRFGTQLIPNSMLIINGHHSRWSADFGGGPSLNPGVIRQPLGYMLEEKSERLQSHLARYASFEQNPFVALNTAYFSNGFFIYLPRNVVVETPIVNIYASFAPDQPLVSHPRTLIVAEENSQATIIDVYLGPEGQVYFTNAVTEIALGANAVVNHVKLNQESQSAYHVHTMQVELERGTNFSSHNFTFGGAIVRNDHNARFHAENAECTLNGLYLAKDEQLVDNHTDINHAMPHCDSHEIYKGILDGRGRGVFNGKIFVQKDAQKTDAKQTNQTLLLSKQATINTKPQLEIYADDVKCTHGATVGQLEAESLFYLRSRGISEQDAQNILVRAFADDIIERIKPEALQEAVHAALYAALPQSARAAE